MRLKRLILVRNGDYDSDLQLSNLGYSQINFMADKLIPVIGDQTVTLITSPAVRAVQSTEILSGRLGIPYTEHKGLWSGTRHQYDLVNILELVRTYKDDVDVLILVTHFEYAYYFPGYFAAIEFKKTRVRVSEISRGQAINIDCQNRSIGYIF